MYFEQPDAAGHNAGPNSDAVDSALIYVDAMINYLAHRLDQKGYLGCINMVILSDHGMQKLKKSQFIAIEEFININDSNVEVFGGAIGNIHFPNKTGLNLASKMEKFARREGHKFRAYTKETMPKRYHYANNRRIGDIIIDAVGGTEIFKTYSELNASTMEGDHGFDNRLPSMRAIFGAYGPSVKENFTIPPFQNIELYNLFTDLMGLTNFAPNNGTRGLLNSILRKPKDYEETPLKELPDCIDMSEPSKILTKCGDGCQFEIPVDGDENIMCHKSGPVHVPERIENIDSLCVIRLCNATMIYNKDLDHPLLVESLLSTPIKNIDHRANCSVHLNIGMDLSGNETTTPTDCSSYQAKFNNGFNSTWITYFSDHGAWKELLQTIEKYQKHYKNLLLYSGPIYDTNFDGLADSPEMVMNMTQKKPTHFYIILIRCRGQWYESYGHCQNPEDTRTLAFVLPNISDDFNNLIPFEYLFRNTARIRDIELLTGLELFTNRDIYPPETALRLRTHVNQRLWQLEVDKEIL